MSVATPIQITDQAVPFLKHFRDGMGINRLQPLMGRAGVNVVQQHFRALNATRRNALNGPRTNFYNDAARQTNFSNDEDGVTINVNKLGIRQRLQGGTITPKRSKYLTIPAIAEAYGKRASEAPVLLRVMWRRKGGKPQPVALVEAELRVDELSGGVRLKSSRGARVWYWLAKSVTQRADPEVMPPVDRIAAAVIIAINNQVDRLTKGRSK